MDYAAIAGDPSGASPWGSSSPRTDTFSATPDLPSTDQEQSHGNSVDCGERESAASPELPPTAAAEGWEDQASPLHPDQQQQQQKQQEEPQPDDLQESEQQQQEQQNPSPVVSPPPQLSPGQSRSPLPARYQNAARQQAARQTPQYRLQAKVTGLERIGKKDPILRFDVHTNIPRYRTSQIRDIRRMHSEFVKFADYLISSNPECLVPAVPPPLTPAGAGTEEDELRIKASMQRWLNIVCSNPVLLQDEETQLFIESDFGYSPMVRMKQPATGVRRKVLKQFAPPPDDTPELHDARPTVKLFYLGTMDAGQKLERIVKARRALALAESDFGVKLSQMHVQENHTGLSIAYRKLGRVIQTVGDYRAAQGTAEATTLEDPFNYFSSDALIVKETLTNRHILLRELIQAQQTALHRRQAADRLRVSTSVRHDKVDEAIRALEEADKHEDMLSKKTQRITANLLQEKRRWFSRTTNDVLFALRDYTLRQIEAERRTLSTLESVRPDIRAIDASGGLSRLGREAHPPATVRRASLAASQGPKGDAWSGVPRRGDSLSRSISGGFTPALGHESEDSSDGGRGIGRMHGLPEDEDEDRVDARNAASRLAASTF